METSACEFNTKDNQDLGGRQKVSLLALFDPNWIVLLNTDCSDVFCFTKAVHLQWQKLGFIIAEMNYARGSQTGLMVLTLVPEVKPRLSFTWNSGSGSYSVTGSSCSCLVQDIKMDMGILVWYLPSECVNLACTPEVLHLRRSPLVIHMFLLLFGKWEKK